MVDPSPKRSVDGIALRRLNDQVAATQPYSAVPKAPAAKQPAPPPKRHRGKRVYVLSSLATLLLIGGGALALYLHGQFQNKFSVASIAVSAVKAAADNTVPLQGQDQGRTNFLVFGMTKDGLRTDSIMLASYYYQQKKLVTLNIPRDLYVYDGFENAKFGEVYAYAKARQRNNPQYPDQFVTSLISKEYGIPVQYWTELNMQGEVDLVNSIGGVSVNVPDGFTDYEYPTWNYTGYIRPAPSFAVGLQHLNGDQALIYSRSRHSLDNSEGSDFARSKRQGLVLQSIMTTVKSQGILDNLTKLTGYLGIVQKNVTTNLSTDEMLSAAKLVKGLNPTTDHVIGNWSTTNGFLCSSTSSIGAYIALYGVIGSCTTHAGGQETSVYRQDAISYVQNLLKAASPPPTQPAASSAAGRPGFHR